MTKNQTPEFFFQKIQSASSDTTAMKWMMKAEAALSTEDFAALTAALKAAGL